MENNNVYDYILNHLIVKNEEIRKKILFEIVSYVAENETEDNSITIIRSYRRVRENINDIEGINDLLNDLFEIRGESKIQLILQGKINFFQKYQKEAEERIAAADDEEARKGLIGAKKELEKSIKKLEVEMDLI
jgi:hypothetical protein